MKFREDSTIESTVLPISAEPWVLLVDDDLLEARSLARHIAARFGIRVAVARSLTGLEQLLERRGSEPVVAILDYQLSADDTGLDALTRLRRSGSNARVAFHTGAATELRREWGQFNRGEGELVVFSKSSTSQLLKWLRIVLQRSFDSGEYFSVPDLQRAD